jgi:hypothetical protein
MEYCLPRAAPTGFATANISPLILEQGLARGNRTDAHLGNPLMRKSRTEITIETDRIIVISRSRNSLPIWCQACEKRVSMVTIDEAAIVGQVSSRAICRWIEKGELHFIETASGRLLICLDSIPPAKTISSQVYIERQ